MLRDAIEQSPTYVGLGCVFDTPTKPTIELSGLQYIKQATELLADTSIAHAALGGITIENVEQVLQARAKTIAVCSAVTGSKDPTAACKALKEKITVFTEKQLSGDG